jgi:hypothetical protein
MSHNSCENKIDTEQCDYYIDQDYGNVGSVLMDVKFNCNFKADSHIACRSRAMPCR